MIIRDGNLRFALLTSLSGQWIGVDKDCNYFFGFRNEDFQQPVVSIDYTYPVDYTMTIENSICYVQIGENKYTLWYRENSIDVKLELHTLTHKIRLMRVA